jgi:hypothetical protein
MGRTVTDKQVRGLARDVLPAYSKATNPGYQSHEYTAAQRTSLLAVFRARAGKSSGSTAKRGGTTRKARTSARAAKSVQIDTSAPDA